MGVIGATRSKNDSGPTLAFNVGGTGECTASDIAALSALGTATGGFTNGAFLGLDTANAAGGVFTCAGALADPNDGANALGLVKLGGGTGSIGGPASLASGGVLGMPVLRRNRPRPSRPMR